MNLILARNSTLKVLLFWLLSANGMAQCPLIPVSDVFDHTMTQCEGGTLTMSATGENLPLGSTIDWYLTEGTQNPYDGEGVLIGSSLVIDPNGMGVEDFVWTIPDDFCDVYTGSGYAIVGVPNPPPVPPCLEVLTPYYGIQVGCGSIELTGGGDVCEGNCPEAPTEMIFTISGNDGPYTVDIEVSATLFGTFPINGLEVSNGEIIYVCLEGFFPSFDPSSGILNVPVLAIGFMASVEIVSATTASGCSIDLDQNSITLHFIAAPTASVGSDQTICAGETVNVSGSIGGSAQTSMWSTSGDGTFNNELSLNTIYTPGAGDIANGEVMLTLFSMDENGSCIPGEASLTVFINPSLQISVNTPMTICNNDIANVVAMVTGSSEPCLWETDGDGIFDDPDAASTVYTPGFFDILNGTVTLYYTPVDPDACVQSNEPLVLTLAAAPVVDIPQDLEICEGDSVVIEIDISGDFALVTWSYPGDGVLLVEDDFNVTYTPGPMDIDDQFFIVSVTVQSPFPECGSITHNIPVYVVLCDCPDFDLEAPANPLCFLNDTLDLADLLVAGGSGAWSITGVPPGANSAELIGGKFITNMSDPGTYTITYSLNFPEPGCPAMMSEIILVQGVLTPFAGNDVAFCGYQNVPLTGNIIPSTTDSVLWETLGDGMFANAGLLNTTYFLGAQDSMASSISLVLHVIDPVCSDGTDTITLYFNQAPSANFIDDTISICNVAMNGSVLNFNALITGGDNGGIWSNPFGVPVDFSNPSAVDFDGVVVGYYMFQYETNSALSPCAETVYTIIVQVDECLCPLLIVQNVPDGICNSLAMLPLDAFVQAGGPGTWQIISTPSGSNPASLTGSTLIINGCDPGSYDLRFTFDAAPIDGCPDSAEINIVIQGLPLLSLSNDTAICGEGDVQVEAFLSGSATGVQWITTGSGMLDDASLLTPTYSVSANDLSNGLVYLIATATDTFGFCPAPSDSIILSIQTPPFATLSAVRDTICNNPDSNTVINFSAFIIDGDTNGFWWDLDASLVDLSDPAQVDFEMVQAGSYQFVYTTQSAIPPCVDSVYIFTVLVEDCACPVLDITTNPLMFCEGDGMDLNDLITNAAPGQWEVSNGPSGVWPVITGSSLNTTNAAMGSYTITYSLIDSVPDCPASVTVMMALEAPPAYTITNISCDADHIIYEVIVQTDATSLESDFGIVTNIGSDGFSIDSILSGQNIQVTLSGPSGLCNTTFSVTAPNCDCTLFIEDIADTIRFCPGDTFVLIPFVTGAQGLPFSTWVTPTGTVMQPTLPLTKEGKYIWIVRDEAGCEERDTFFVSFMMPVFTAYTISPQHCPGVADGAITIDAISGGIPPFIIQIDNEPPSIFISTPYYFTGLASGNHFVSITDNLGCSSGELITVDAFPFGAIDLGPDQSIHKGDSAFIQPFVDGIDALTIAWNPSLPNAGLEDFWFGPEVTTLLSVVVTDSMGCVYEDEILITVYEVEKFYIPNIFSPNNDGVNDVFEVVANFPPEQLLSLEIFDRWGSLVYSQFGTNPYQWNGLSKGEEVQGGVYVYKFTWKDNNNDIRITSGDVTVLR